MCVVLCRASLGASPFFSLSSTCRSPVGPLFVSRLVLLRDFPKIRRSVHCPSRASHAHLFQAWLSYSPSLIRRYVGKMCPSRVPVLHLTHTLLYSYLPLFLPLATVGEKRCSNLSKDPFVRDKGHTARMPYVWPLERRAWHDCPLESLALVSTNLLD